MKKTILHISISCAVALPAFAQLEFYEGDRGTQNLEGRLSDRNARAFNLKNTSGWDNDEIRSMRLKWALPGTIIRLFDDPNGGRGDDWVEITVKRPGRDVIIDHLEQTVDTTYFKQVFHRKNGLNGKVSHIQVEPGVVENPDLEVRISQEFADAYSFSHKNGAAYEYKSQDSNYRLWYPEFSVDQAGNVIVTLKMDHIRGGAKDDHAQIRLKFDKDGLLADISVQVEIQDDRGLFTKTLNDVWDKLPEDTKKDKDAITAKALAEITAIIYADIVGRWGEHGGRKNFPSVIEHNGNRIADSVRKAIGK